MKPIPADFLPYTDQINPRPWWTQVHGRWVRVDGATFSLNEDRAISYAIPNKKAYEFGLFHPEAYQKSFPESLPDLAKEHIDQYFPLRRPAPRLGQRWIFEHYQNEIEILEITGVRITSGGPMFLLGAGDYVTQENPIWRMALFCVRGDFWSL